MKRYLNTLTAAYKKKKKGKGKALAFRRSQICIASV
jgi:hypothetical protein